MKFNEEEKKHLLFDFSHIMIYNVFSSLETYYILLLLLLYNIYIAHYIAITISASHYKTIKIIQDTNWYEVKVKNKIYIYKQAQI